MCSHNHTPTTSSTISLHDALPIFEVHDAERADAGGGKIHGDRRSESAGADAQQDRKSTRLNSSHVRISYAVFCLKKKSEVHRMLNVLIFTLVIIQIIINRSNVVSI